jgi:hypothetical protein
MAGQSEKESRNRTAKMGQGEQDRQKMAYRTTAKTKLRTGLPAQDCQYRTARKGIQYRIVKT